MSIQYVRFYRTADDLELLCAACGAIRGGYVSSYATIPGDRCERCGIQSFAVVPNGIRYLVEKAERGTPYAAFAQAIRTRGQSTIERLMAESYAERGACPTFLVFASYLATGVCGDEPWTPDPNY